MKISYNYPVPQKKRLLLNRLGQLLMGPMLLAGALCVLTNILVGGKAWCVIAVWGLYMVWSLVFAPDLIEYNFMSQFIKINTQAWVMLILIEVFLQSGWMENAFPIVCFSTLAAVCVLFFTDFEKQKHNLLPVMQLSGISLLGAITYMIVKSGDAPWSYLVMSLISFLLFALCIWSMRGDFTNEIRKMFHRK